MQRLRGEASRLDVEHVVIDLDGAAHRVINMSADAVPLLEPSKPERMVGAAANTLPSDYVSE